jgi:hypothetical protein
MAQSLSTLDLKAQRRSKARIREDFAHRYREVLRRDFDLGEAIVP